MSKRNTSKETIYITVEPTRKALELWYGRMFNVACILLLLVLGHVFSIEIPDSIYVTLGFGVIGIEIGQIRDLIKARKH